MYVVCVCGMHVYVVKVYVACVCGIRVYVLYVCLWYMCVWNMCVCSICICVVYVCMWYMCVYGICMSVCLHVCALLYHSLPCSSLKEPGPGLAASKSW